MSTLSAFPATLIANSGTQTVTLTGVGTNFNLASPSQFVLVGGTGATLVSQIATTATTATLVINPGSAASSLTIVDATDGDVWCTITVTLVTVTISPVTAILSNATTQTLSATVTGAGSPDLTWTLNPTVAGTISPTSTVSGGSVLFVPLPNFVDQVTITATSVQDPTQSASAVLTVTTPVVTLVNAAPPPSAYGLAQVFSGFWATWAIPQFNQLAILLARINEDMPGATPTPAWDPIRGIVTGFKDGSYGVGWQLGSRMGYLAPQTVRVAKNDYFTSEEVLEGGLVAYQGPMVLFQPPVILRKFDLLVFSDGRYVVGDSIDPGQVMGATIISAAKMEQRSPDDITQSVPLV